MKPKILIVDDKPQNLYTLEKLLQRLDVEVVQTTSPFEALDVSLEHDLCMAIVDIQMPEMDGYELVELWRSNEDIASLPVIFVSAIYSDEYHHHKGYEAGAVDFLSKPFNPEILLSKVRVFLDLYNQRKKLQELAHLEQKRRLLSDALREVAKIVGSVLETEKLLDLILIQLGKVVTYDRAAVALLANNELENNQDELTLVGERNKIGGATQSFTMPADKYPLNLAALQEKRPILVADVSKDERWLATNPGDPTRSLINAPLLVHDHPIGLLNVGRCDETPYTEDDAQTVSAFASQVAIAFENARLVGQIKDANEELARMNADKDKFFSIVAHDLRGPFLPLLGNAQLLEEMAFGLSPRDVQEMSASIRRSAKLVFELLENLLQWSRMQMGRMTYDPEQIVLHELIAKIVELLMSNATSKNITLQSLVEADISVYADENMLNTVIRNLVNNAIKFTPDGGEVMVEVRPCEDADFVEISVSDTGVGISEENIDKLFRIDVHHSTAGTAKESGTGLGLIMCKEMVEMNRGKIWIESELGEGTTVKFTVPTGTMK
jgi:signal transduction histidine kinase